jgi:hypothetical protein
MVKGIQRTDDRERAMKSAAAPRKEGEDDDPCRCKQVSVMTPRQLLGTMLRDLAFWKKGKKR